MQSGIKLASCPIIHGAITAQPIDVNGKPIGAVVSNPASSRQSPISVEGFMSSGDSQEEYLYNIQQTYPGGAQSIIYQFDFCTTHSGVFCSYPNGANPSVGPASAYPMYVGH
ncbi:MAG: hypothetical protein WB558_12060 [Terriglobales bacterium]